MGKPPYNEAEDLCNNPSNSPCFKWELPTCLVVVYGHFSTSAAAWQHMFPCPNQYSSFSYVLQAPTDCPIDTKTEKHLNLRASEQAGNPNNPHRKVKQNDRKSSRTKPKRNLVGTRIAHSSIPKVRSGFPTRSHRPSRPLEG